MSNVDQATVEGFGSEWSRFDHSDVDEDAIEQIFDDYFAIFPWDSIDPTASVGADFGSGSGRWARLVAERCGKLYCVDAAADAVAVARRNLAGQRNVEVHCAPIDAAPIEPRSLDFGYSLGVLHHIPDTRAALRDCVAKLKPGAPFLLYLYYALDNRGPLFRTIWRVSDAMRSRISQLPETPRHIVCDALALTVYLPFATTARVAERVGLDPTSIPLAYYRDKPFYTMRNDSLDRFGTRLEQRFTKAEITEMMRAAGLRDIRFSDRAPFWCAVGYAH